MERFCFVHCLVAYMKPEININEFSHLLGTVIFAKSATVVHSTIVVHKWNGNFLGQLLSFFDGEFLMYY